MGNQLVMLCYFEQVFVQLGYRNTPQKSTKRSSVELLFGRRLRSSWDMLIPDVRKTLSDTATRNKIPPSAC